MQECNILTPESSISKEQVPAIAYVPRQHFHDIYENLSEGFANGTIFPELNKPFTGRKGGTK